jgi:hypothetical protein
VTHFLFKCQFGAVIMRFSVHLNSVCLLRAHPCSMRTCCWKTLLPPPMLLQCSLRARRRVLRRWPLSTTVAIWMSCHNRQSAGGGISPWGRLNEAYLSIDFCVIVVIFALFPGRRKNQCVTHSSFHKNRLLFTDRTISSLLALTFFSFFPILVIALVVHVASRNLNTSDSYLKLWLKISVGLVIFLALKHWYLNLAHRQGMCYESLSSWRTDSYQFSSF